jgi:hypothetical protein
MEDEEEEAVEAVMVAERGGCFKRGEACRFSMSQIA